jgi:CelD/BcsL family acetyltransferase involved in cellulose biosynthesis
MNVDVVPAESLSADQIDRWKSIQESDPAFASPFFSPHFTRIVATARDDVHVAVLEEGGRVVAFFPFQRGRFGAGRPAGWKISDYQGGVAERDATWDARALVRACGLKTWEFDHVIAAHSQLAPFARRQVESPVIDLSRGFDAYVRERRDAGVHVFRDAPRKARKLAREHGELRFEADSTDPDAFRTLMRWKRRQYVRKGAADVVARPWVEHSLELAYGRREPNFAGILSLLFAGDRVVAAHFGLRSASVWHYWFPAYDAEFHRYSPGILLLLRMAEHATSLGLGTIDLGRGDERYKSSMGNRAVPLIEGHVELPSFAAVAGRTRRRAQALAPRTPTWSTRRFIRLRLRGLRAKRVP